MPTNPPSSVINIDDLRKLAKRRLPRVVFDYLDGGADRAKKAGFNALVVTIDTPVAGLRERDPRNGMKELLGGSLLSKLPYVSQFFARPSWFASFLLDGGTPPLANIVVPGKGPMPLID